MTKMEKQVDLIRYIKGKYAKFVKLLTTQVLIVDLLHSKLQFMSFYDLKHCENP